MNLAEHRIETDGASPVHVRPHRVSLAKRRIIQDQVKSMFEDGTIVPSVSPWSAPVVLVKKKSGSLRFCIYRRLSAVTRKDVYPSPKVDYVIGPLAGAKFFSSLDLASGFRSRLHLIIETRRRLQHRRIVRVSSPSFRSMWGSSDFSEAYGQSLG